MKAKTVSKEFTSILKSVVSLVNKDALNPNERAIKIEFTSDQITLTTLQHNVCRLTLSSKAEVEEEGTFYILSSNVSKLISILNKEESLSIFTDEKGFLVFESEKLGAIKESAFYNPNAFNGLTYDGKFNLIVEPTKGLTDITSLVANSCYKGFPIILLKTEEGRLNFYSKTDNSVIFNISIRDTTCTNGIKGYFGNTLISKFKETTGDTHSLYWSNIPKAIKVESSNGDLFAYSPDYGETDLEVMDNVLDAAPLQQIDVKYKDLLSALDWQTFNNDAPNSVITIWTDSSFLYVKGLNTEPAVLEFFGDNHFKEIEVSAPALLKIVKLLDFKQDLISLQRRSLDIDGEDFVTLFLEPKDLDGSIEAHAFINPIA